MAYNLKITVFNNRDYEQIFTLKDSSGNPMNLTGCTLIFGIGKNDATKPISVHKQGATNNKCVFVTNGVAGEFELKLPYVVLKELAPANYIHDLVVINTDNERIGIWSGIMIVKKGNG